MHKPTFDPSTGAGRHIAELFSRIKSWEHEDGTWPLDVIDELTIWFTELGIDVNAPAILTADN